MDFYSDCILTDLWIVKNQLLGEFKTFDGGVGVSGDFSFDCYHGTNDRCVENEENYTISLMVPGLTEDLIKVKFDPTTNELSVITSFKKDDVFKRSGDRKYIYNLPKTSTENIKTSLKNGVLTIIAEFAETKKAQEIKVG
jgi:hypothetical protein